MLRETMIRTMPVAMIAIDELWTDRFQRLRGVRNRPPDRMLNPIQMIASAAIMPSRRVSTSVERTSEANVRRGRSALASGAADAEAIRRLGRTWAGSRSAPRPRSIRERRAPRVSSGGRDQQPATAPAVTPLHSTSLVIQPADRTSFRLVLSIGSALSRTELTVLPLGVEKGAAPAILSTVVPLHSWTAASPAALPSIRESFQTSTAWVPSATRFRAAASPSWPETDTLPWRPWAVSAATTP